MRWRNHRVKKEDYRTGSARTTYYVRDVAGQVMAIYSDYIGGMALAERPIYGNGRIGVAYNDGNADADYLYELTDHLGNVRAVFTKSGANTSLEGYTDYYPGGMVMPGRNMIDANGYRYGYQGQFAEKDEETGLNAFQLRMYDSRIMRWLSPDPYGQFDSPYLAMGNNWISFTDPDGGYCPDCPDPADTAASGYTAGDTFLSSDGNTYTLLDGDFGWSSAPEVKVFGQSLRPLGEPNNNLDALSRIPPAHFFQAGQTYDITLRNKTGIDTPVGGYNQLFASYDGEKIVSEGFTYPEASVSPKNAPITVFLQSNSKELTFFQNASGASLEDVFNQTDEITTITTGSVIFVVTIQGMRDGHLFWEAHQRGSGLGASISGTAIPQKPNFRRVSN